MFWQQVVDLIFNVIIFLFVFTIVRDLSIGMAKDLIMGCERATWKAYLAGTFVLAFCVIWMTSLVIFTYEDMTINAGVPHRTYRGQQLFHAIFGCFFFVKAFKEWFTGYSWKIETGLFGFPVEIREKQRLHWPAIFLAVYSFWNVYNFGATRFYIDRIIQPCG